MAKWAELTMGSFTNIGSYKTIDDKHREAVDEFFRDRSRYWRDVYQADTLSASIYRERHAAVLAMVDKLGLPKQSNVMEVGCGAGLATVALAKRGLMVTAADAVEDMLGLTRQASVEAGVESNVKTSLADVCRLSFPSQYFELVVAVGVLPWLGHPENALSEIFRVTRTNGYIILTVDSSWCLNQILDPLCFPGLRPMRWKVAEVLEKFNVRVSSKPRLRRHSIKLIDGLVCQTGFQKVEWRTLGFGPFTCFKQKMLPDPIGIRIHRILQALADRQFPVLRSLGTEYVVLARRP